MAGELSHRRMTLRQLLTHSEKCTRDLIDQLKTVMLTRMTDFRDLSRPVRRRSHYPTLLAMQNALKKLQEAGEETSALGDYLYSHLEEIQERGRRERISRI